MMIRLMISIVVLGALMGSQDSSPAEGLLSRRYRDGERLNYLMKGRNNGRTYEVRLTAVVKKGTDGQFVEEYAWSDLVVDGVPQLLTPASREFRQAVTLAGGSPFTMPDLSKVQPGLIGPVTDLLTFYADLFLATHAGQLREPGDRFFFANPTVGSWADGTRVLIGEDSIDFDIHLTAVDRSRGVATLLVKHVPPKAPKIRIPAEWMREPVAGVPNNWVQVRKAAGAYIGAVGKETFDVELTIRLSSGEILSATMDNRVEAMERECVDVELSNCGERRPDPTIRHIEMSLTNSGR
ncbi:MAG TPA: hypothetical protein VLE22_04320 [Bryobacteraceae bacterium]|nr:hypothetical protein [Bryobacteraceae bacterium]